MHTAQSSILSTTNTHRHLATLFTLCWANPTLLLCIHLQVHLPPLTHLWTTPGHFLFIFVISEHPGPSTPPSKCFPLNSIPSTVLFSDRVLLNYPGRSHTFNLPAWNSWVAGITSMHHQIQCAIRLGWFSVLFFGVCVYVQVPMEARSGFRPSSWSHRWLGATCLGSWEPNSVLCKISKHF